MQFLMPDLMRSDSDDLPFAVGGGIAPIQPQLAPEPVFDEPPAAGPDQAAPPADMLQRMAQIEAFHIHVNGAIESLVDTILHVRNHDLAALQTQVQELEQQLQLERTNRDLAEVSRMHPKERTVVFVGGTYFGDNVKYAWLEAQAQARAAQDDGFQCWFLPFNAEQEKLVRAMGANCLPHQHADWSADHLHTALSAAVAVVSDHLLGANPYAAALLAGARQVQMWHGVSIKEIGFRNLGPLKNMSPQFARVLKTCGRFSSFVGTAGHNEAEWRRWFAFDSYAPIGYARNDVLHRTPAGNDLLNVDMDAYGRAQDFLQRGRKVYLYAPTFRDANPARWILQAGLDRIAKAVADAGDCLIVNMHPVEQPSVPEIAKSLPGVVFVKPRTDVYPLLTQTSALITDYSSIMFDYLHLDRPVLLFRPDHESYTTRSRKLFDAKLKTPPGPVAQTAQALVDLLKKKPLDNPAHARARQTLAGELYDRRDGTSAERLVQLVRDELALAHTVR
jgi:CDP-glycerol glycerophosphotransferase